jgi:hypothetical protein
MCATNPHVAEEENAIMLRAAVVTVLSLAVVGCSGAPQSSARNDAATPAQAPAAQPAVMAEAQALAVTGSVLETMDSGGYTYLKLKTADGEIWSAVGQADVKVGQQVTVSGASWMQGFESKSLKRTFDRILFGNLDAPAAAGLPPGHPAISQASFQAPPAGAPSTPEAPIKVDKAEGKNAHTIAEVYAGTATLKDTEIVVRGKVVKFNAAIMGRNWLHIRDGSGSRDKQNDDLTVTTADTVAVGDVVIVRGKLAVDKDFGSGYEYPVIVEDARVAK